MSAARVARSGPLAVSWLALPAPHGRFIAFSISKRVGKAVVRNRLRRQLREAFRLAPVVPSGAYLVRVNPKARTLGFRALSAHLLSAMSAAAYSSGDHYGPRSTKPGTGGG